MDKNTVWAGVLSFLVIFLWFQFFGKNTTPNVNTAAVQNVATVNTQPQKTESEIVSAANIIAVTEDSKNTKNKNLVDENYSLVLENNNNKMTVNQNGAITSFLIKEARNKNVELVYSQNNIPLTTFPKISYDKSSAKIIDGKSITLNGKMNEFIAVKTTYEYVDDKGHFNIKMNIQNLSDKNINISNFKLGLGAGIGSDGLKEKDVAIKEMIFLHYSDNKLVKKYKEETYPVNNSWIAISNNYFMASLIDKTNTFKFIEVTNKKLPTVFYKSDLKLEPNQNIAIDLDAVWGIKNYKYLKTFEKEFDENVSLGFFGSIGKLILFLLSFFYSFTGNYGWSIILLTTILQVILLPLNKKSYQSMHAMKKLQPKLENLKTKHKSDPQKLNMEMMQLYKTEKVNPFSGCLPLLLQLPIFWALFTALNSAAELRHAPFIFWITDLSRPDTIGHLGGIAINILPILMGITMYISQKLNTSGTTDPMQAKMFAFMPVLFLFMFWGFPSGLVLYWLVSNIYTIGLNAYLTIKNKEEVI